MENKMPEWISSLYKLVLVDGWRITSLVIPRVGEYYVSIQEHIDSLQDIS